MQAKSRPINLKKMLAEVGIPLEEVLDKKASLPRKKADPEKKRFPVAAPAHERVYLKTGIRDSEMNPWDVAHQSAGAFSARLTFVEPDMLKEFSIDTNVTAQYKKSKNNIRSKKKDDDGFDPDWPPQRDLIWHQDDDFSQWRTYYSR